MPFHRYPTSKDMTLDAAYFFDDRYNEDPKPSLGVMTVQIQQLQLLCENQKCTSGNADSGMGFGRSSGTSCYFLIHYGRRWVRTPDITIKDDRIAVNRTFHLDVIEATEEVVITVVGGKRLYGSVNMKPCMFVPTQSTGLACAIASLWTTDDRRQTTTTDDMHI